MKNRKNRWGSRGNFFYFALLIFLFPLRQMYKMHVVVYMNPVSFITWVFQWAGVLTHTYSDIYRISLKKKKKKKKRKKKKKK